MEITKQDVIAIGNLNKGEVREMPFYEYKCPKCGHEIEELQGYDDPPPECEKCKEKKKSVKMKRLISKTSFILKGGGWYKDGYSK